MTDEKTKKQIEAVGRMETINSMLRLLEDEIKTVSRDVKNDKADDLLQAARMELIEVGIKVRDARAWVITDMEV